MPEDPGTKPDAQTIVVTGAAGRLGERVVRRFAADGARVAAVVRTDAQARAVAFPDGGEGAAYAADVTDEASVAACFAQIEARFGRVDVLVHTVGAWAARPLLETALADWDRMLRVNLTSAFLCFREAARRMPGGGRLIGIAAAQGADRGAADQAAYSAAKGGLVRLVEAAAAELSPRGVTAHAVAAGFIRYDEAGPSGVSADDLVDLCRYLATPAADALNGATLRAYG